MDVVKPLNYAPPLKRFHRWNRRGMEIIFFAGIVAAVVVWGPSLLRSTEIYYWQDRALGHRPVAGKIVYELDLTTGAGMTPGANSEMAHLKSLGWTTRAPTYTVFLHEMTESNGTKRLMNLDVDPITNVLSPPESTFSILFYESARTPVKFGDHFEPWIGSAGPIYLDIPAKFHHLKVFEGQIDPTNPSHMTFNYDVDGHLHTVDGWIHRDGGLLLSTRP